MRPNDASLPYAALRTCVIPMDLSFIIQSAVVPSPIMTPGYTSLYGSVGISYIPPLGATIIDVSSSGVQVGVHFRHQLVLAGGADVKDGKWDE